METFFDDLKNLAHRTIRTETHEATEVRLPQPVGAIAT